MTAPGHQGGPQGVPQGGPQGGPHRSIPSCNETCDTCSHIQSHARKAPSGQDAMNIANCMVKCCRITLIIHPNMPQTQTLVQHQCFEHVQTFEPTSVLQSIQRTGQIRRLSTLCCYTSLFVQLKFEGKETYLKVVTPQDTEKNVFKLASPWALDLSRAQRAMACSNGCPLHSEIEI